MGKYFSHWIGISPLSNWRNTMSHNKKPPKSNTFSLPEIFFCMVGFILMVQNPLWINLIILFCSVMFLLPLGLAKYFNGLFNSQNLLTKLQNFINRWYEKNVPEEDRASSTVIPNQQQIVPDENSLEQPCDFNTIPEPPEDHYQDSYDDVWANYDNEDIK